ncbi:hypothetical protein [Sphingobacterium multivorum]|uniref:hypothetical protein n=1 Tax=Sphingobacterium multivorum TaxID=28454 RepID=UPI0028B038DC|nr:hypothetical protein [Sphingobacterium multivorum]
MRTDILVFLFIIIMVLLYIYRNDIRKYIKELKQFLPDKILTLLFNKKDSIIINLALKENISHQKYWIINNLITPLIILFLPLIFTMVSSDFKVIKFEKTFQDLALTGALTMIGINIMRTNLTTVGEVLKSESLNSDPNFQDLLNDNESLKSKLRSWVHILTIVGAFFYFIQVGGFIDPSNEKSFFYIIIVFITFIISAFFARILSVVQSNFVKNEDKLKLLLSLYTKKNKIENEDLEQKAHQEAQRGGLIE